MNVEIVSTDPVLFDLPVGAGKHGPATAGPLAPGPAAITGALWCEWTVTREEIKSSDTRRHLASFNASLPADLLGALRNRVITLVAGYENDPREIYEIPEVRNYFAKLAREGAPLLFFAAAAYPPSLRAIAACIAERVVIRRTKGGEIAQVLLEGNTLKPFLAENLTQYFFLSAQLGHLPHEALENMASSLAALLGPRNNAGRGRHPSPSAS